jgi:GTP-binding protein LepA
MLDAMDLERERGITIKMHPVTLTYLPKTVKTYELNFIDTPGHVDFSSEVSRSLQACEGALLVIDAAQGIEAQTLANYHLALEQNLTIIPVINKIDLPAADVPRVARDRRAADHRGQRRDRRQRQRRHRDLRDPRSDRDAHPAAQGQRPIICAGWSSMRSSTRTAASSRTCASSTARCAPGMKFMSMAHERVYEATEVGVFKPEMRKTGELDDRQRRLRDREHQVAGRHGRRRHDHRGRESGAEALPGYKPIVPMVYCGLYPNEGVEVSDLRDALEKLALNDSALHFEPESRSRWASGSAADSWASCTWRSCKSGSSATTIST